MRPEASNKFTVHCDICQEPMRESAMAGAGHSAFHCYPCNNVIYESDLPFYSSETVVPIPSLKHYEEVMRREVDVSQSD